MLQWFCRLDLNFANRFELISIAKLADSTIKRTIYENTTLFSTISFSVQASALDEALNQCIADRLQAYNSDIYYNLLSAEVKALLSNVNYSGYSDAMNAARLCKIY